MGRKSQSLPHLKRNPYHPGATMHRNLRWLFPLRTLLGQIVRQGLNHSANPNPIKRLVDFFNEENHFQTAHNLWHITSTMLQNGGLKNRLKKIIKTQKLTTKFLVIERWPFKMANGNEKNTGN